MLFVPANFKTKTFGILGAFLGIFEELVHISRRILDESVARTMSDGARSVRRRRGGLDRKGIHEGTYSSFSTDVR